jgi:hypothetical protein
MNMVKRRGSTTVKPVIKNFIEVKTKYLTDIKTLVNKHNIPPELIKNWDHTGIHLVPVSKWTMAEKLKSLAWMTREKLQVNKVH